jgi:hypothetical protein
MLAMGGGGARRAKKRSSYNKEDEMMHKPRNNFLEYLRHFGNE